MATVASANLPLNRYSPAQFPEQWRQLLIAVQQMRTPLPVCTVAELPTSADVETRGFVTDATARVFGEVVTGGGSIAVPVYFDGAWRVG